MGPRPRLQPFRQQSSATAKANTGKNITSIRFAAISRWSPERAPAPAGRPGARSRLPARRSARHGLRHASPRACPQGRSRAEGRRPHRLARNEYGRHNAQKAEVRAGPVGRPATGRHLAGQAFGFADLAGEPPAAHGLRGKLQRSPVDRCLSKPGKPRQQLDASQEQGRSGHAKPAESRQRRAGRSHSTLRSQPLARRRCEADWRGSTRSRQPARCRMKVGPRSVKGAGQRPFATSY